MSIRVITDKCVGCNLCIKACPFGAISVVSKKAIIDLDRCNLCGACVEVCKFDAIILKKEQAKTEKIKRQDTLVYGYLQNSIRLRFSLLCMSY